MEMDQLEHQNRFSVALGKRLPGCFPEQGDQLLFARRCPGFELGPLIEKILVRFSRYRNLDAESLPSFQIYEAVRGDGEQPRFQRATSLKFREKSLAIWTRGETIRPQIGGQILGFGFACAARAENADDFALITTPQFGGRALVPRQHALRKGEILLVTRFGGYRHEGIEDEVLRLERQ